MTSPRTSPEFLLLFRGTDWDKGLSPEEIQNVMNQLMRWFEKLQQRQQLKSGHPLGEEGRSLSGRKGRTVSDGPFAESKEAIGGYLIVQAANLEEAVQIARGFPCLEYGGTVEVRPIAQVCPTLQRVKDQFPEHSFTEQLVPR